MEIVLRRIQEKDLELLMNWRMRPDITKYMFTDPVLTMDDQLKWFKKISKDDRLDFVIEMNNTPVGYSGIYDIDRKNRSCSGGIYVAELKYRSLDSYLRICYSSYDYMFFKLKLHKHYMVFMEGNPAEKLAQYFGATYEGTSRDAIYKYGKYHNLKYYSILDNEWSERKKDLNYEDVFIDV